MEFLSHKQISDLLFWNKINLQIRLKAKIKKSSKAFNNNYFFHRDSKKNALAISSQQSQPASSYEEVIMNYNKAVEQGNLDVCPEYWGGYTFTPYYFEFWEGHSSRINKRDIYQLVDNNWVHTILQP